MHVFLTGASGYLGSRIAAKLLGRGDDVTGLVRRAGSAPPGVVEIVGDLRNPDTFLDAAAASEGVIHTAFGHEEGFDEAVGIERQAVDALIMRQQGSGKPVILSSAVGILGDTGDAPATEDTPVSDDFPARIRGFIEEWTTTRNQGVSINSIRLPVLVYGCGGSQFLPLLLNVARRDGVSRYVGDGTNRLAAVHVEDAADAYLLALRAGSAGRIYNVAAETLTSRALAEAVATAAGIEQVESVTLEESQAAIHPFVALLLSKTFDLDASATQDDLGWTPHGLSLVDDVKSGSYAVRLTKKGTSHA